MQRAFFELFAASPDHEGGEVDCGAVQAPTIELEQPLSIDISGSGCIAVLDRGGLRLVLSGRDPEALDRPARACRFFEEHPLLLFDDGLLKTPTGERQAGATPTDFAVAPSGSVYVIAGGVLERVGELPLRHEIEGTALATATGGVWVCGERAVLLRPEAPEIWSARPRPTASPRQH